MRFLTAALCTTLAAALLAGCSSNGSSASSAMPGGSGVTSMAQHGLIPQMAIPKNWLRPGPYHLTKLSASYTKGIATSAFESGTNYIFMKNNASNGPPVCTSQNSTTGVNNVQSDSAGDLIVPDAYAGIEVYAPPFTSSSCGTLLGTIPDSYGQAVDAASLNAVTGTIVVGHSNGAVAVCTLASLSCSQLSSNLDSFTQVAFDKAGNCYAESTDASTGSQALEVYTGCTGSPVIATGFSEPYLGGIVVDNKGNLTAISLFNASFGFPSTATTYSGCATGACTVVAGPTALTGESIYGGIGRQNQRFVTFDLTDSEMEVYSYKSTTGVGSLLYNFNNGLSGCPSNICEAATYLPNGVK